MLTIPLEDNALTTLEIMKALLGIAPEDEDSQRDTVLTLLINAASSWVEGITGRKLGRADYLEDYIASGQQELVLRQWPVRAVESITEKDTGLPIDPETYDILTYASIGALYRDLGWTMRGYVAGLAYDMIFPKRYLRIAYTAGYILPKDATEDEPSDLPYELQALIWGMVQQEFALLGNGSDGLSAFSISDVSWTFDKEPRAQWLETARRYARL